jgi:3-oxocholest-4-en-26-oyl-CoA dehydrogenase beta subunit
VDFSHTTAQRELSGLCRQILADRATPERLAAIEASGNWFDADLWRDLARAGILAAALPAAAGGAGYGLLEQCTILTELGRAVAPVPYLESIVLGAGAVAAFGSPQQIRHWAEPSAAGDAVLTAGLSETGSDDPRQPVTRAQQASDGWLLTGTKTMVPFAARANVILVPALTEQGPAVFGVQRADPGVTVREQRLAGGATAAQVELTAAVVGPEAMIGGPAPDCSPAQPAGWLLARATIGLCALQLGIAERALELTAEHARTRRQFDRPIGAFQAVAQRLADAWIDADAIRLTLWQAAWRLEQGLPCDAEIATAKFWAAEAGHRIAHTAVHVHGGIGIDISHPVHRYFLAAKRNEFALGGATAQLRRLGAILAASAAS